MDLTAEELQKLFDEYAESEGILDEPNPINIGGFIEFAGEKDVELEAEDYDTPINGLKSFYDLMSGSNWVIEEGGYDEFWVTERR